MTPPPVATVAPPADDADPMYGDAPPPPPERLTTIPLTRTQLAALTTLHREGRIEPYRPPAPRGGTTADTTAALIAAGVAAPSTHAGAYAVVPVVQAWADAVGNWHAAVPASIDAELVARAVIRGELGARENIAGYRIRLDVVGPIGNDRVEHVESTS